MLQSPWLSVVVAAAEDKCMKIEIRIKQSEIRVRSGVRLVFFIAVVASVAWVLNIFWLAKILTFLFLFFSVVTLFEYWNAWRLKKRL